MNRWSIRSGRYGFVLGVVVAVVLGPLAPAAVAAPLPPCSNYEHREAFGSVLVDTRIPPNLTYVTWLWNIDDPTEREGLYNYSVLINGRVADSSSLYWKDDNLHSALPAVTVQGTNWRSGDTFALRAEHLSEGQNAIYVATNNGCVIP